jgi:transposase
MSRTGRLPIDNNPVENIIRPIAIGKKDWLFVGVESAGKCAVAIQRWLAIAKIDHRFYAQTPAPAAAWQT